MLGHNRCPGLPGTKRCSLEIRSSHKRKWSVGHSHSQPSFFLSCGLIHQTHPAVRSLHQPFSVTLMCWLGMTDVLRLREPWKTTLYCLWWRGVAASYTWRSQGGGRVTSQLSQMLPWARLLSWALPSAASNQRSTQIGTHVGFFPLWKGTSPLYNYQNHLY